MSRDEGIEADEAENPLDATWLAWVYDRSTLAMLPTAERDQWEELAEVVWERITQDAAIHDGCVPEDSLTELRERVEELEEELQDQEDGAAGDESTAERRGYALACDDIIKRIDAMMLLMAGGGNGTQKEREAFAQARQRMADGVRKLRARGPKPDEAAPEPANAPNLRIVH